MRWRLDRALGLGLCLCGLTALAGASDDALDMLAQDNARVPSLSCATVSAGQRDEMALSRSLIEKRIAEGQLHAAYAEVLSLPPRDAQAAALRADILRRLGRPEAGRWYTALLKTCQAPVAHHGLGLMAARDGNWTRAVQQFQQAVRGDSANSRFRSDLGYALLQARADAAAEFELQAAAQLDAGNRLAGMNLLLLAMVTGNAARAERYIAQWQPDRQEFDTLWRSCAEVASRRAGQTVSCPLTL